MGHQVIIIEGAGTFDLERIRQLVTSANQGGLQIHHASVRYQGETHFTHGTGEDLARTLADLGKIVEVEKTAAPASLSPDGTPTTGITLDTVLAEVRAHRSEFQAFARYEKKDDKAKSPKPPKTDKKEAPHEAPKTEEPKDGDPAVTETSKPQEKTAEEQSQQPNGEGDQKAPPETPSTKDA